MAKSIRGSWLHCNATTSVNNSEDSATHLLRLTLTSLRPKFSFESDNSATLSPKYAQITLQRPKFSFKQTDNYPNANSSKSHFLISLYIQCYLCKRGTCRCTGISVNDV